MKKLLLAATMTAVLAACQSTPETQEPAGVEDRAPKATPGPTTTPVPPGGVPGTAITDPSKDPRLKDPASTLSKRSVYFEFDSDAIKVEYVPVVEAHAAFLRQYKNAKMLIQGNADERGSREYNLGLGQRRSDAIKKRLVLLGATESQVESVSLGEEKPVCAEHDEACWGKNRRGDMLYGGEY
ncbi:MAG TPA: peptidoglycan-associated lipoprotein Pal [Burkholderiales bacterium]|nr:peptidoglycan-associated lipoprotein Pal [Burkholderiales bacterium]